MNCQMLIRCLMYILIMGMCTHCRSRHWYTAKDVERYYKQRKDKPISRYIEVDNRKIHYVEYGSDTMPLLVLIHGAPGAWYGYLNLLENAKLRATFHMISVDRPGYGRSGEGWYETSIQRQADYIYPLVEHLVHRTGQKAILLGRSYGAPIAAKLALVCHEKIRSLMLLAPAIDPEKEKYFWFTELGRNPLIKWILPPILRSANEEKLAHEQELYKMKDEWKYLHLPVRVFQGKDDDLVDTSNITFARKYIGSNQLKWKLLDSTGHLVSTEREDFVVSELLDLHLNY